MVNRKDTLSSNTPHIFFSILNQKYTITQILESTTSILETGDLPNTNNYNSNIKIDIQTDNAYQNKKNILINNELVTFIDCSDINYFYTIFSDKAETPIKVSDLLISE